MHHPLIVLADRSRARFFTTRRVDVDGTEKVELIERTDLVSPEHQLRDGQVYTTSKSGLRFSRIRHGSHTTTFDEHRDAHHREVDTRFAKEIARQIAAMIEAVEASGVILATDPRQLGLLRPALEHEALRDVPVLEIHKDLTHLAAHELHAFLAGEGLLPALVRPTARSA